MSEIERAKCSTPDFAEENAAKLLKLFPECAGEQGTVDLDKLRQVLSSKVVEGNVERYEFTWPGKRAAKAAASAATTKTLRPCREESVNFDSTENLYIEGDNLEVLKLLQTSYAGKVKMIYIDPPYNTGHDFVYRDRFSLTDKELADQGGAFDEEGNRFEVNDSAEARYHSNWCSMMYPRLKLAKSLMREDGVIFMSIDDNELMNLRKLCDEIFGASNFVDTLIWEKRYSPQNAVQWFSESHEYVLVYAKDKQCWQPRLLERTEEMNARYRNLDNDPRGDWKPADATAQGGHGTKGQFYVLTAPNGTKHTLPAGRCWLYTEPVMKKMIEDNRIWFGTSGNNVPAVKKFLTEVKQGIACQTIWKYSEVGHSQSAKKELIEVMGGAAAFDTPKPVGLLKRMVYLASMEKDDIFLDFFSGSATTAHAVMQQNAEDGGSRKFIMVQLPEACADDSEAVKANYKNICEIGKERVRRAGKKIADENATTAPNLDVGFRVLKLDSSSLNDTSSTVSETSQTFENFDRIKSDRTPEDLLFQMLLETHIPLSDTIETKTICGNSVFLVADGALVACLDPKAQMTTEFFLEVAKLKPAGAFFRDDAFANDSARTNLQQAFDQFSPTTSIKVI